MLNIILMIKKVNDWNKYHYENCFLSSNLLQDINAEFNNLNLNLL